MHPSIHASIAWPAYRDKQAFTHTHTHSLHTHTNIQKLLVLALFSTAKLLSLSPRLRLYYLLLYYTTPTFTPAPREWEVIANANELCVGLLWASVRVWAGRSESAAACLRTCSHGSARVCQTLSMCGARPQAHCLRTRSFYLTSCTRSSDL